MTEQIQELSKQGRGPMWALLIVTGLPFVLAMYLFYNPDLMQGIGSKNNGQLVQPTVDIPVTQLQTLDGKGFDTSALKGNWTLLLVENSACDDDCMQNLFHLRQIRLAMGEDRFRVQRMMLLLDGDNNRDLATQVEPFTGTHVITGPADNTSELTALLAVNGDADKGRMYMIDPQGQLIMSYAANPPWKDVLKDLQHVLKIIQM